MSKIKLLLDVIEDMRSLGDSLHILADAMASDKSKEEPLKLSTAEPEQKPKEEGAVSVKAEKRTVTLEQVRAVLAEKSRVGFTSDVKAIIIRHGADKLSDIAPMEFEAVLAEAEVLGNG